MKTGKWLFGVAVLTGLIFLGAFAEPPVLAQDEGKQGEESAAEALKIEDLLNEEKYEEARDLALKFVDTYTEAGREAELTEGLYIDLGVAYFYLKDYDKAVEALDKALEKNFWNTKTLEYKATCFGEMGRKEEVVEIYGQILELEPEREDIQFNLAHLLEDLGRMDEAFPYYDRLVEEHPGYKNVAYDVGALYYNKGEKDKAMQCFEKSLAADSKNENANLAMGKLYLGEKDNPKVQIQAIPYFETYLEVSQNDALKSSVEKILEKLKVARAELEAGSK